MVYRTNHAYEGGLKEAFEKLTGKDGSRKSPHDIENHLEKSGVLRSRVLDIMRNYRQEWRNPSTHEYELFFTEQEALLAIITVSAFVAVLLDQIIDQLAVQQQQATISEQLPAITSAISNYQSLSFPDQVVELIRSFLTSPQFPASVGPATHSESYFEAAMANFLREAEPSMTLALEPVVEVGDQLLRPDLLLEKGGDTVVVEIKRAIRRGLSRDAAVLQVLTYARHVDAKRAIVVFMPDVAGPVAVVTKVVKVTGVPTTVTEIYPDGLSMRQVEHDFMTRLKVAIEECHRLGYHPNDFEGMLSNASAVHVAEKLVTSSELQAGLKKLSKMGRLDLSVESIMLEPQFSTLFKKQLLDAAQWRLDQVK